MIRATLLRRTQCESANFSKLGRFAGRKKPIEELRLEDLDKAALRKYEQEYQKMMYSQDDA